MILIIKKRITIPSTFHLDNAVICHFQTSKKSNEVHQRKNRTSGGYSLFILTGVLNPYRLTRRNHDTRGK